MNTTELIARADFAHASLRMATAAYLPRSADDTREMRQGGTPFEGFVGPVEGFVGSETYVTAHSGMECGALRNPNMTALGPAGINFDPRFICPSADNLVE